MGEKLALSIDVITLFPGMFDGPLSQSLIGRAREAKILDLRIQNLRQWSDDPRHQKVDDRPYGGGAGMVMKPEPLYRAIKALKKKNSLVIYLSPQGKVLNQKLAETLAKKKHLIFVCGHYEGIDERVMPYVDQEISIGDYVLTGGELPAMVVIDAVARLVPGVVGDPDSIVKESFSTGILDYPHYTRPSVWRGQKVPDVLLSGNHRDIDRWRADAAIRRTKKKRPALLKQRT